MLPSGLPDTQESGELVLALFERGQHDSNSKSESEDDDDEEGVYGRRRTKTCRAEAGVL